MGSGLFDASSSTQTSDSRQTAGDSSQLIRGTGAKLIQGGTDYSKANINTGVSLKNSKITGNDFSKTKFGKGATVTIGANPDDLTTLAQSAIDALGRATAFTVPVPTTGSTPAPAPTDSGSGLNGLIGGLLSGIGQGQTPASPASSGDDNASGQSTGIAAWWNGLSSTVKWGIAIGGVILLGALLFFGRKS